MPRPSLVISILLVCLSCVNGQDPTPIPEDIKQHMASMVGAWSFQGSQGDREFSGVETIRLVNNKTALIQEGYFDLGAGKKEHYVILSGWDGTKKTVVVRGFTSIGVSWTGEWKQLVDGKWKGTASGGAATFEVKENWMRYEDAGEGTPWISIFKRTR